MGKKIVVALGGNALEEGEAKGEASAQLDVVRKTCQHLAQIVKEGYDMTLVHGNGPQVGRLLIAMEAGKKETPPMPLDVCNAMTQAYIGYHIQQALSYELKKIDIEKPVVTLTSQVLVDKEDSGFLSPTKPVGPFYTKNQAEFIAREKGYIMKEDAGRGYRRLVPSPKPIDIIEKESIKELSKSSIVIACGGGGIPVIEENKGLLEGIAAVIDKDFAAELLAREIGADILLILTAVDNACINFGTNQEESLGEVDPYKLKKYAEQGQFASGSMLPKIEAAINFVESGPGRQAIICSLDNALEGLSGEKGTRVIKSCP